MIWIIYFIKLIIENENPLMGRSMNRDLSEVDYPAITICSEQTTKYAFAERLGNYIDPELELSDPLKKLKKRFFDRLLLIEKYNYVYYEYLCKKNDDLAPESCKVVFNN